ncbi:MAG: signal peptidase I [Proteobacteria bacterium]|nr:signal peptidase I [Pseudomonadota bacterium]
MEFDFHFVLLVATLITGAIWGLYRLRSIRSGEKIATSSMPKLVEYSRSFFPVLFIVLLIRSFFLQIFVVPTGSLEPTIQPVEFILLNMYTYGLRLPVFHKKILSIHEPKRGDIVQFYWPVNSKKLFIKRLIGLPGDHISYVNKVLTVNGKLIKQTDLETVEDTYGESVLKKEENLLGVKHFIYLIPRASTHDFHELVVPKGHYFVMGDNRDLSDDSRYWGFVPEENLVGKGMMVLFSWDRMSHSVRWDRLGARL